MMTLTTDRSPAVTDRPALVERIGAGRRIAGAAPFAALPVALVLWATSVPWIDMSRIGDYGLIPLLPFNFWLALGILLVGFSVLVRRASTPTPLLVSHVLTLVAILHATPSLVYGTLRYPWAWRHVAVVDYFLRHDGVDTSIQHLPVYQFWPAFFNMNVTLTEASGLQTSEQFAAWAPLFWNVLLIGPLLLIAGAFTADRRLVWSTVVIFILGCWVGQDYFAPQACTYFLFLTVMALCLRHFGRDTGTTRRHRVLLAGLVIVPLLAAIVPTHQLTPLMAVSGMGLLATFCRYRLWVLTVVMICLTLGWFLIFARSWLASNDSGLMSSFGSIGSNFGYHSTFVNLAPPRPSQVVVTQLDRAHSAAVWALALVGLVRRRRWRRELAVPILALAPLPLVLTNDYGGEMIFRVYLFGLPFVAFYAAAAFFPDISRGRRSVSAGPGVTAIAFPIVLLLLVPGFAAGYYGKEQANYVSPREVAAARFIAGIAPRGSLIIGTSQDLPIEFVNFEFYDYLQFATYEPQDRRAILADPVGVFAEMMRPSRHHHAYLMISRVDAGMVETTGNLPPGALARIVRTLSESPKFTMIYSNADAVVLTLTLPVPELAS